MTEKVPPTYQVKGRRRNPPVFEKGIPLQHHLELIKVEGHESRGLSKAQWWYRTRCKLCGTEESLTQDIIKYRQGCRLCHATHRAYVADHTGHEGELEHKTLADVPDFSRLRW